MSESKDWVTIKIPKGTRDDARDDPRTYEEIMQAGLDGQPQTEVSEEIDQLRNELSMVADATVSPDVDGMMEKVSDLEREMKKCQELAEQARDEAQQVKGQLR